MSKKTRFLTPQQELFLVEYTNPRSSNFGNARQSALKAGYKETYADNITDIMPAWLLENIGDLKRLKKAERVLDETLEMDTKSRKVIDDEIIETEEPQLLKIKQDTAKFIAAGLGKHKYATKQEIDNPAQTEAIKSLETVIKEIRK